MGLKKLLHVAVFFLMFNFICPSAVWGDTGPSLRISQVSVNQNGIFAYVYLANVTGDVKSYLAKRSIQVEIDKQETLIKNIASFKEAGEGVGYVLMLDISKTVKPKDFEQMKAGLNAWIDEMGEADRAAIMVFGENVHILQPFTADKAILKNKLKDIVPKDNQNLLHSGLMKALDLANTMNSELPKRRAIITFSSLQEDFAATLAKQEVRDRIKVDKVPVYAVSLNDLPLTEGKEQALKAFREYARNSGGELYRAESTTADEFFAGIRRQITNTLVVQAYYEGRGKGPTHHIEVTDNIDGRIIKDGADVSLIADTSINPPTSADRAQVFFVSIADYLIAVFIITAVILGFLFYKKKHKLKEFILKEETVNHEQVPIMQGNTPDLIQTNTDAAGEAGSLTMGITEAAAGLNPAAEEQQVSDEAISLGEGDSLPIYEIKLTVIRSKRSKLYEYRFALPADKCVIGRQPNCEIVIKKDSEVSGKHCELWLEESKIWLKDMQSTNGTFLNGINIQEQARIVEDGDVIGIGRTELRISFGE